MKSRSRLKHAAAGLLGALLSRNNDVGGYWALGLLDREVSASPRRLELDLVSGSSRPAGDCATIMVTRYTTFLRAALEKQNVEWAGMAEAAIQIQFNAEVSDPTFYYPCEGNPVIVTVTLRSVLGHVATMSAIARCHPYRPNFFSQSNRLGFRVVIPD